MSVGQVRRITIIEWRPMGVQPDANLDPRRSWHSRRGRGVDAADMPSQEFALADELGGELSRPAAFAGRTAQDQGVSAVLHDRLRVAALTWPMV